MEVCNKSFYIFEGYSQVGRNQCEGQGIWKGLFCDNKGASNWWWWEISSETQIQATVEVQQRSPSLHEDNKMHVHVSWVFHLNDEETLWILDSMRNATPVPVLILLFQNYSSHKWMLTMIALSWRIYPKYARTTLSSHFTHFRCNALLNFSYS